MSSIAPSPDHDNDLLLFEPVKIHVCIDGVDQTVLESELVSDSPMTPLELQFYSESTVGFLNWEAAVDLGRSRQKQLFHLATYESPTYTFCVNGKSTDARDPFEASLALPVSPTDLKRAERLTDLATNAAGYLFPKSACEAAQRIKAWLERSRLHSEPVNMLTKRIRECADDASDYAHLSPQDGAAIVFRELQKARLDFGEVEVETPPLRVYQDQWYQWQGKYWKRIERMMNVITRLLQRHTKVDLSKSFLISVEANLKAMVAVDAVELQPPFYVDSESPLQATAREALVFANGVLEIGELQESGELPELERREPKLFATRMLSYDYDPDADCPLWRRSLDQWFPRQMLRDFRVALLQEAFGYTLLSKFDLEAFFVLEGAGANGKSTVLDILTAMLGPANVSFVPLESFGIDAHLYGMDGKMANIASEMHRLPHVGEATLKALVSREPRQVNRKFLSAITMYPTAKLFFATNNLPPISDSSEGTWRRMFVIPFREQFRPGSCDPDLTQRLLDELPGILNWALVGARQLLARRRFLQCDVCDQARENYRMDSNPFRQFLDECCELSSEHHVVCEDLYIAYDAFCARRGRGAKGAPEFGRMMAAQWTGVVRRRSGRRPRPWIYYGIRLLPTYPHLPHNFGVGGLRRPSFFEAN